MAYFRTKNLNLLKAIGQRLPGGWRFDARATDNDHRAEFIGPNGAGVMILEEKPNRWKAYGVWPSSRGWHSFSINNIDRKSQYSPIGFNPGKGAAAIAADIVKRLFPHYLTGLAKVHEYLDGQNQKRKNFDLMAANIETYLPVKKSWRQSYEHANSYYFDECGIDGELKLNDSFDISLNLNSLTLEQAYQVINLLKKDNKPC